MWHRFTELVKQLRFTPKGFEGELALLNWAQSPRGRALLSSERERAARLLAPTHSGYHFLVLGPGFEPAVVEMAEHSHFFRLSTAGDSHCQGRVNFDELPLPSDLLDTVVMHHMLEYSPNPHRVLNEATRVLSPGGHLLIIAFNPYSFYGLFSLMMRIFSKNAVWQRHPLRKGRLLDWLKLLHMQPVATASAGYLLPKSWVNRWKGVSFIRLLQSKCQLPLGAYQIILAKKVVTRPIESKGLAWQVLPKTKKPASQLKVSGKKPKESV